jgi:hypothetical protein
MESGDPLNKVCWKAKICKRRPNERSIKGVIGFLEICKKDCPREVVRSGTVLDVKNFRESVARSAAWDKTGLSGGDEGRKVFANAVDN